MMSLRLGKLVLVMCLCLLLSVAMTLPLTTVSVGARVRSSTRRRGGAMGVGMGQAETEPSSVDRRGAKAKSNLDRLELGSNYYTIYHFASQGNLKIKVDGSMEWNYGHPNIYNLFHERLVHERGSRENMYMLEATASAHLICMNERGRLYTVPMKEARRTRTRGHWGGGRRKPCRNGGGPDRRRHTWRQAPMGKPPLSPDCLFRTYELTPEQSYEQGVGIYSYPHSNLTHGLFLSRNSQTGNVRSYLRRFANLDRHPQIKLSQLPVRYLREMIMKTRFGREEKYNEVVRGCLLHLLSCPNQRHRFRVEASLNMRGRGSGRERGGGGGKRRAHLYTLVERCKRRATFTETLPKCRETKRGRSRGRSRKCGR